MINEGEKGKKIYKKGDRVTFRLTKKMKYSEDVIDLVNNENTNVAIIEALDFYCKYKDKFKQFEQLEAMFNKYTTQIDIENGHVGQDIEKDMENELKESVIIKDIISDNSSEEKEHLRNNVINLPRGKDSQNDASDEIFNTDEADIYVDPLAKAFKSFKR